MSFRKCLSLIALCALVASCATPRTYRAEPNPVGGVNIYGVDGGKLEGTWALVIDDSVKNAKRSMKTTSHACSLHIYEIDAGDAISSSMEKAATRLFQDVLPRSVVPTKVSADQEGFTGAVVVKLDEFNPKFSCSIGQHEGHCTANTDISLTAMLITFPTGEGKYVHASANRSTDGGGGSMCSGVSGVINESIEKTMKDVLERLGEKIVLLKRAEQ